MTNSELEREQENVTNMEEAGLLPLIDDYLNLGTLARYSGMPVATYKTHLLMTFLPSPANQKAYQAAIDFCTPTREHHFFTLAGEVGRGKTHLALGIGWQWLTTQAKVVNYWQVSELLDAMRAEYNHTPQDSYGNPTKGHFDHAKDASLLILDDLGVEKSTEWAVDKLDTLVNHRWLEGKPTVFTTNLAPNQLQPRIRSRIKEGVIATLDGVDYREYKAKLRKTARLY